MLPPSGCRRDLSLLSPLLLLLLLGGACLVEQARALAWPFQSSSQMQTLIRLRAQRVRRPDSCRESLPRKADELPALVAVGRVKQVFLSGSERPLAAGPLNISSLGAEPNNNRALVSLQRIFKGKRELLGSDIIVTGFNSSNPVHSQCPNFVKPNDTLILLLEPAEQDSRKYTIQGSNLLSMNLQNLDKINALAADEPLKRRGPIEDILCEAHYCPYGRCKIIDIERAQVRCECPESCASAALGAPSVCGSDNSTYPSECHLILEGCRRQRPLFVTKDGSC